MKPRDLNSLNQYTMMKTELESVVAFVQKMNPEIMELKFGCKVDLPDWKNCTVLFPCMCAPYDDMQVNYLNNSSASFKRKDIKILGRDITLEDVLTAYKYDPLKFYDLIIGIDDLWVMRGKPLHLQSPELITFLFNNLPKV